MDPTDESAPCASAGGDDEDPGAEPLDDKESDGEEDSERDLLGFYSSSSSSDDDELYPTEHAAGGDGDAEDVWGDLLGAEIQASDVSTTLHADLMGLYDATGDLPASSEGTVAVVAPEQPALNPFVNPAVLSMAASVAGPDKDGKGSTAVTDAFDALLLGDEFAALNVPA